MIEPAIGATKTMLAIRSFLPAAILITTCWNNSADAKTSLNFSRHHLLLASPDNTYAIQNSLGSKIKDSNLLFSEEPIELLLTNRHGRKCRIKLLKYHRNVDVFWAPNSKALVINDWKKNNSCDAYLYNLDNLQRPFSLKQKLIASRLSVKERALTANKEYNYVFVDKWIKPGELNVKASGHFFLKNKTVAYTLHYLWKLKTNKWTLLKMESTENLERDVPNLRKFGA